MKKRISLWLALVAITAVLLTVVASAETFLNPVAPGADPYIFKDDDGMYYLYATSGGSFGYRVYSSPNLVEWKLQGWCLTKATAYTDQTEGAEQKGIYNFWAPEVYKINGAYVMFYTAQEHIGIAKADSPMGPFTNDVENEGYLFPEFTHTIDANLFHDEATGKWYLYFVSSGANTVNGYTVTGGNNIWGVEFDVDTMSVIGDPVLIVRARRGNIAEGPEMIKNGNTYYLTFSDYGYEDAKYSIGVATSQNPLTGFVVADDPLLITDDPTRADAASGNHLYGTGHHSFVESPDGTELWVVYHAHRSGVQSPTLTPMIGKYNSSGSKITKGDTLVQERKVCLDRAYFDAAGLHIGSVADTVPTVGAQDVPSGAVLENQMHEDEIFSEAVFAALPTVYVAGVGGDDNNDGATPLTAVRSMDAAYALLPNGGTMILTEEYEMYGATTRKYYTDAAKTNLFAEIDYPLVTETDYYEAPAVNGPVLIKGMFSSVPVAFKFWSFNSDTYLDNLALRPLTGSGVSILEGRCHNIVIGEGVSCTSRPVVTTQQFPIFVGGYWQYMLKSGTKDLTVESASTYPYAAFTGADHWADFTSPIATAYTSKIYGGTWSIATEKCLVGSSTKWDNGVSGKDSELSTLVVSQSAQLRPSKGKTLTAAVSAGGALITVTPVDNDNVGYAPFVYQILKDGKVIGYTEPGETTFLDTEYVLGKAATYSYAGYLNGACIGDVSAEVLLAAQGDMNEDGDIDLQDVLFVLRAVINGSDTYTLVDALRLLKFIAAQ